MRLSVSFHRGSLRQGPAIGIRAAFEALFNLKPQTLADSRPGVVGLSGHDIAAPVGRNRDPLLSRPKERLHKHRASEMVGFFSRLTVIEDGSLKTQKIRKSIVHAES